jgi:acid phosphatase family membrane protein YuiD
MLDPATVQILFAALQAPIVAAGGMTTSVVSLVTAMAPDFAREPGRSTFAALQALRLA